MKRGPMIHGVLLVVALLLAYQTWTREEKVERKVGDIQIWSVPEKAITAVVFDTKNKTIRVEKRTEAGETYYWGTQTTITRKKQRRKKSPPPDGAAESEGGDTAAQDTPDEDLEEIITSTVEFPVVEKIDPLFPGVADMRALRELATPTDEDLKEYGLDESEHNITVTFDGGTHSLVVGGQVYGGHDRYVRSPASGRVYVVAGAVLTDLIGGEGMLRLRKLHGFEDDAVATAVVTAGGKTRSLVRITVEEQGQKSTNWADSRTPDRPDQTMANFLQNLDRLRPSKFEPELDTSDLTLLVKVEYQQASGGALGWLELYEKVEAAEPRRKPEPQAHDPAGHDPAGHDPAGHDPAGHDHEGHDHAGHDHAGQAHDGHDHGQDEPADTKQAVEKRTYYLRTELTRSHALVPNSMATRITEDIGQLFTE